MPDLNLSYTPENIFDEVAARARQHGVTDQAGWNNLVEDVIEEHRRVGEIHDDSGTEDLEAHVRGRWEEFKATLE